MANDYYKIIINSSNGTHFVEATILSTILTVRVLKNGTELTSDQIAECGTIKWYKSYTSPSFASGTTLKVSDTSYNLKYIAQLEDSSNTVLASSVIELSRTTKPDKVVLVSQDFNYDLHHEYHFLLDGESSLKYFIRVEERPEIPSPKPRYKEYTDVLAKDGTTRKQMGTYEDIEFKMKCNFAADEYYFNDVWRKIKNWLLPNSAGRKFKQSYDNDWYYVVSKIEVSELSRVLFNGGQFTITFTVEPYVYSVSGDKWYDLNDKDIHINNYATCQPLYQVINEGTENKNCIINLKNSNGNNTFELLDVVAGQNRYIDTERKVTYYKPAQSTDRLRAGRNGEEEDLQLYTGINNFTVTDGFSVKIKPRWRSL